MSLDAVVPLDAAETCCVPWSHLIYSECFQSCGRTCPEIIVTFAPEDDGYHHGPSIALLDPDNDTSLSPNWLHFLDKLIVTDGHPQDTYEVLVTYPDIDFVPEFDSLFRSRP